MLVSIFPSPYNTLFFQVCLPRKCKDVQSSAVPFDLSLARAVLNMYTSSLPDSHQSAVIFFFLECNKPKKQSKIDHLSPHSQHRLFPYWQRSNMVPYWGMYGLMVHINQLELRTVDLTLPILSFLQLPSAGPPG